MGNPVKRDGSVVLFAVLLAALVLSGCQSSAGRLRPEISACQPSDPSDGHAITPTLPAVAAVDRGKKGVLLLAGPAAHADGLEYVVACRYERGKTVVATDSVGSTLSALFETLSVDRAMEVAGPPQEHVLAGRMTTPAAVEVVLDGGATVNAALGRGYWIAWWSGPPASVVRALDPDGNEIASEVPAHS